MTTKTTPHNGDDIQRIRLALPSGSFTRIVEQTNLEYQLVHRTLHGHIKRWDARHDQVITTAKKILADAGYSL
jgi:hypothetical protein